MLRFFYQLHQKLFHHWMRLPQKIRFLLVGGYNTVFSYGLYALFVYIGIKAQVALLLSFAISSINSYVTQKIYVFATKGDYFNEYVKCLCTWTGSYAINAVLLFIFMQAMGMNAYLAELIVLILLTIYSYVALKYFAFRGK